MSFELGSVWRKWDLQVHTPYSVLNHGDFGNGYSENDKKVEKYIYKLITKAIQSDIKVIGLTDYFTIDGYKKVSEILNDPKKVNELFKDKIQEDEDYLKKIQSILILPNIEFRLDKAIFGSESAGLKFQIHVIFSNELSHNDIEENFLNQLTFMTEDGYSQAITKNNIVRYGDKLKESGIGGNGNSLFVGMNNIYVPFKDVRELLNQELFRNKHIIVLPEEDQSNLNWKGQTAGIRKNMYSVSDALFSSNEKTISWGKSEKCFKILNKQMPCLWGSDAHNFNEMFNPDLNRFLWIKADTTFNGLLQALKNFNNRIYIGELPEETRKITSRSKLSISHLESKLKNRDKKSKVWFDIDLEFNPSMISIIGNKGSGKSAISDILGFMGNTYNYKSFSFLNSDRFLDAKTKYGSLYKTKIRFSEEKIINEELSNKADYSKYERIKYLPQKYIEEIVNDLGEKFQAEINNTIFSHISIVDKGNTNSLQELISYKSKTNENHILNKKNELIELNKKIFDLESKMTIDYKNEILAKLSFQKQKYQNHLSNKPNEIKPVSDKDKNENYEIITELNKNVLKLEEQISDYTNKLTIINNKIQIITDYLDKLKNFGEEAKELNKEYKILAEKLNIEPNNVVEVKYNLKNLQGIYTKLSEDRAKIKILIDDTDLILGTIEMPVFDKLTKENIIESLKQYSSLKYKKYVVNEFIKKLSSGISLAEQRYLSYITNLKSWNEELRMITGEIPNTIDGESIKKYEDLLKYIDEDITFELTSNYKNRLNLISEIYDLHKDNVKILSDLYQPVQEKINKIINSDIEKIEFIAQVRTKNEDIIKEISTHIDSRVDSDFRGKTEGYRKIQELVNSTDFNNKESVLNFITDIFTRTTSDKNNITKLLSNPISFYNYISSMEYLNTDYTITSNDKTLKELSPGERGIILLIFYLALSNENIPLVIDQPEDNLDNQSIYSRLVPAILESKNNRQVIIVTHNPNIAIACDSEQIIYCEANKETGELKYTSGSIENPKIMEHIINVLEGTKPAFDKRKTTYE